MTHQFVPDCLIAWPFFRAGPKHVFCVPCAQFLDKQMLSEHINHLDKGRFYCVSCKMTPNKKFIGKTSARTTRERLVKTYGTARGHKITGKKILDDDQLRGCIAMHLMDKSPRYGHAHRSERKKQFPCAACHRMNKSSKCPTCMGENLSYAAYVLANAPRTEDFQSTIQDIIQFEDLTLDAQAEYPRMYPSRENLEGICHLSTLFDIPYTLVGANGLADGDYESNLKNTEGGDYSTTNRIRDYLLDAKTHCTQQDIPKKLLRKGKGFQNYALLVFRFTDSIAITEKTFNDWFPEVSKKKLKNPEVANRVQGKFWYTSIGVFNTEGCWHEFELFSSKVAPTLREFNQIEIVPDKYENCKSVKQPTLTCETVAVKNGLVYCYRPVDSTICAREEALRFYRDMLIKGVNIGEPRSKLAVYFSKKIQTEVNQEKDYSIIQDKLNQTDPSWVFTIGDESDEEDEDEDQPTEMDTKVHPLAEAPPPPKPPREGDDIREEAKKLSEWARNHDWGLYTELQTSNKLS